MKTNFPMQHLTEPMPRPEIPYTRRAAAMDKEYVAAFAALPPAKREALKRLGIEGPELNDPESHQGTRDVSDFVNVSAPLPSLSDRQRLSDAMGERFGFPPKTAAALLEWIENEIEAESQKRKAHLLARVAGALVIAKNVKVSFMGLAFACEFGELNISRCGTMHLAAKRIGCSPAYISQFANYWADLLEIPRPKGMKSAEARASYKAARKDNHWRKQKCQTPKPT